MRTAERLTQARPLSAPATTRQSAAPGERLAYRPALDGLRAIAVLAVFAYHLGFPEARGGFLGVDVFFVLSGFLITSLLLLEHARTGGIALGAFWGRRARRLLPALLLVVAAVAIWEWSTAAPFELPQRRGDLLWALFYGSNWNLIATAQDYFAQYGSASLVRHTWSLAIEEQFYLLWPLAVLIGVRVAAGRTRMLLAACVVGIVVSALSMAALYSPADPSRAYYGTETRVHQLLIGALVAVALTRVPAVRAPRRWGSVAVAVGLGLLFVCFVRFGDDAAIYYRGASVAIAIAVALVIWGLEVRPAGAPARVLGIGPLRWVGTISYGIYLWHWPMILIVTAPAAALAWLPGPSGLTATRVLLTFVVAGASFRFVERPIREGTAPWVRASLPRYVAAVSAATIVVALWIVAATSVPAELDHDEGSRAIDDLDCSLVICVRYEAPTPGAPVVAVVGDSIARSLDVGFVELAERRGWTYIVAATGGCRMTHLLTYTDAGSDEYEPCYEATPALWDELIRRWDPDLVVAVSTVELADFVGAQGEVVDGGSGAHLRAERRELRRLADTFTSEGARLVLVEAPPSVTPPDCFREAAMELEACAIPASADVVAERYNAMLPSVATSSPGVVVVSLNEQVCPGGICRPAVGGVVLRYDGHHFTAPGARIVVPILLAEIAEVGALPSTMA